MNVKILTVLVATQLLKLLGNRNISFPILMSSGQICHRLMKKALFDQSNIEMVLLQPKYNILEDISDYAIIIQQWYLSTISLNMRTIK